MPLLVATSDLRPKMRLAQDWGIGDAVWLHAGHTLGSNDIANLQAKAPTASVPIEDPPLDELGHFQEFQGDAEIAHKVNRELAKTLAGVRRTFADRLSLDTVDIDALQETIVRIVTYVREHASTATVLSKHAGVDHYLNEHPANVFYLSMLLGISAKGLAARTDRRDPIGRAVAAPQIDLLPLAMAALFMDVSLWPLEELFTTSAPLTDAQRKTVRNHPIASANMLPKDVPPLTGLLVRTHHENYDGSGYPGGISGRDLHYLSHILRICDAYDAATSKRIYARAKSPVRALGEMSRGCHAPFYDPVLMKMFVHVVQPYPIGARVRLGLGMDAVVVRFGAKDPFQPVVVLPFDEYGNRRPQHEVEGPFHLDEHPELSIHAFGGEDVSDLYRTDHAAHDPLVLHDFSNLFDAGYP